MPSYRARCKHYTGKVYCIADNIEEASRLVKKGIKNHGGFTLEQVYKIPPAAYSSGQNICTLLRKEVKS